MNRRTELTVRTRPSGGDLSSHVHADPPLIGRSRLTILVHGYNNSERQARRAYRRFLLNSLLADHRPSVGQICEFYWPGDFAFPGSFLSYPLQIPRAIEAAERLRDYLEQLARGGLLQVSFVCHSLGNRLALEFIRAATREGTPRIVVDRVCLLAAAVPLEMVFVSGTLHPSAKVIRHSLVLWSEADVALGLAFRAGQAVAGEHCTGAVGSTGGPALLWHGVQDMTPYGHSDYWPRIGSAVYVAREFDGVLDRPPLSRELQAPRAMETRLGAAREVRQRIVRSDDE